MEIFPEGLEPTVADAKVVFPTDEAAILYSENNYTPTIAVKQQSCLCSSTLTPDTPS